MPTEAMPPADQLRHHLIVQSVAAEGRQRKVTSITEITGMEGDVITMQEIFIFDQTGVAPDGTVLGHFGATGIRPRFIDRLRTRGVVISDETFDPTRLYE